MKTSRKVSKKVDEYLHSPMGIVERGRIQMFNEWKKDFIYICNSQRQLGKETYTEEEVKEIIEGVKKYEDWGDCEAE